MDKNGIFRTAWVSKLPRDHSLRNKVAPKLIYQSSNNTNSVIQMPVELGGLGKIGDLKSSFLPEFYQFVPIFNKVACQTPSCQCIPVQINDSRFLASATMATAWLPSDLDQPQTADANLATEALTLLLEVTDRECLAELLQRSGAEQTEYALCALRIGILALRTARGQLDADVIQRETDHLLTSLQTELGHHTTTVQQLLNGALDQYFHPESGRFHERVERLIKQDGELEQLLRRQIGTADSELVRTLVNFVGTDSPLLKALAPDESNQFINALQQSVNQQLNTQREQVLREFSLDNKEGALSKLVREILDSHGKINADLRTQIDGVVKQFSLDQEDSALSNLVRNVEQARRAITHEFSLDNDQSAFSRLKKMLGETQSVVHQSLTLDDENSALARLRRQLLELMQQQATTNQTFQEEIKTAIATLITKRAEQDKSTRHGVEFELVVGTFLQQAAQHKGDICQPVGNVPGALKRKTGDFVWELGPDSASPGARIVIEAKEDQSYHLKKACDEMSEARANREAEVGLFVCSKRTAPEALQPLARYGQDIIVLWDPEDTATDLFLQAGLELARALCLRQTQQRSAQAADIQALDKAINEIEKKSGLLDEMHTWASNVKRDGDKLLGHVQKLRDALEKQVAELRSTTENLRHVLGSAASSTS
jgi:hypothetical protein